MRYCNRHRTVCNTCWDTGYYPVKIGRYYYSFRCRCTGQLRLFANV